MPNLAKYQRSDWTKLPHMRSDFTDTYTFSKPLIDLGMLAYLLQVCAVISLYVPKV